MYTPVTRMKEDPEIGNSERMFRRGILLLHIQHLISWLVIYSWLRCNLCLFPFM
jgi:hypothetical protein